MAPADGALLKTIFPLLSWTDASDGANLKCYLLVIDGYARDQIPPGSTSVTPFVSLAQGEHTWHIVARDTAGNDRTSGERTFVVDTVPPQLFLTKSPKNDEVVATPTVAWMATIDTMTGLSHYEVRFDQGTPATVPAGTTTYTGTGLADGVHQWDVTAVDNAGNTQRAGSVFILDSTPPSAFNLTGPADAAELGDPTPTLTWGAASDATSGVAHYEIKVDAQTPVKVAANATSFTTSPWADGPHTWQVTAVDKVGNKRVSAARTLLVDTVAPSALSLSSPANNAPVASATPALTWTPATENGSGLNRYSVVLDGGGPATIPAGTTTFTTPALPDGPHTWHVTAIDDAGNTQATASRSFIVDTTAPQAVLQASPNPALTESPVTFDATGSSDAATSITQFSFDLDGDGVFETDTGSGIATRSYASPGPVTVGVRVTDAAGHVDTETVSFLATPTRAAGIPGISINGGAQYTNSRSVTLTVVWPLLTTHLLLANDGGFAGAMPLTLSPSIPWQLEPGGTDRLPKTVYARFAGGSAGPETYQDDIVLDQQRPSIASARVTTPGRRANARASATKRRRYEVRVVARDRVSGVASMQITSNRRTPGAMRKYARAVTLQSASIPRWVRVIDRAGNRSSWKAIKRAR